jgi:acetyl esterase/lipase
MNSRAREIKMYSKVPLRWIVCPAVLLMAYCALAAAQHPVILLWPDAAPGSSANPAPEAVRITPEGDHVVSSVHRPSITVYLPPANTATGAAVIVIPGGGHREIWIDHEGYAVGEWLSSHGVAAFVLKYRLAREQGSTYTIEGTELPDVQRALRLVRSRASEWSVNPDRIGVIGFSAGGELAALAGTRYDTGNPAATDPIDRQSSRPAFQGLIYPAIPHDMHLSKETPPAFLACGANDRPDISEGLPQLYLEMKRAGVSAELHIFAGVGHGFGIRKTNTGNVSTWPDLFYGWLIANGFTGKK